MVTWDGAFYKARADFTDHFDIVNINESSELGVVSVTVVFDVKPDKEYVFEIDADDFEADKVVIGNQILEQLKSG